MNLVRSMNYWNSRFDNAVRYYTGKTLSIDAILVSAKAYQAFGIFSDFVAGSSVRDISSSLSIFQELRAFSKLPSRLEWISYGLSKGSFRILIINGSEMLALGTLAMNGLKRVFSAGLVPSMAMQHSSVYSLSLLIAQVPMLLYRITNYKSFEYIDFIDRAGAITFSAVHLVQASPETVRLAWAVSSLCSFGKFVAIFSRDFSVSYFYSVSTPFV